MLLCDYIPGVPNSINLFWFYIFLEHANYPYISTARSEHISSCKGIDLYAAKVHFWHWSTLENSNGHYFAVNNEYE